MEHDAHHVTALPALVCGVLSQLYHKVTLLWEAAFENLRLWVTQPRNKTQFPRQKAAVATALAQLLNSVELYSRVLVDRSNMVILAADFSSAAANG